jgi:hypothetical protein
MHLSTKKLAFLGLLTAVTVLLVIASGILDFNTLFLLAAASFGVGIAIRECGSRMGFGFFLASLLLSVILAPNKLYCITYAAMGLYIVIWEYSYDRLLRVKNVTSRKKLHWIIKYIVFNLMLIPMMLFLPGLIYQGTMNTGLLAGIFAAAQVALFVYDMAYVYFQRDVWGKLRGRLKLQ